MQPFLYLVHMLKLSRSPCEFAGLTYNIHHKHPKPWQWCQMKLRALLKEDYEIKILDFSFPISSHLQDTFELLPQGCRRTNTMCLYWVSIECKEIIQAMNIVLQCRHNCTKQISLKSACIITNTTTLRDVIYSIVLIHFHLLDRHLMSKKCFKVSQACYILWGFSIQN